MAAKKSFGGDLKNKNRSIKDAPKFNKASKQSFKASKGSNNAAVKSEAASLQLEEEVPDFPRGANFTTLSNFPCLEIVREEL